METTNQNEKTQHPEETGKVPASGVMSETYKEEVNPQDELGSSSGDPNDPEKSQNKDDDIDSYPLEEADISKNDPGREQSDIRDLDDQDIDPSTPDGNEFLK